MSGHAWVQERVETVLRGDSAAYGDLVSAFQSGLRGFIAMLGAPPRVVEEIAQDTFVLAYKRLKIFEPARPFAEWLRGIARNLTRHRRENSVRDSEGEGDDAIIDCLMSGDIRKVALQEEEKYRTEHLLCCLDKLPERVRRMVDLKYSARKTSDEIAEELNMDVAAVRIALCRVRLKLRDCVDKAAVAEEVR